jgi:hypothetical protein
MQHNCMEDEELDNTKRQVSLMCTIFELLSRPYLDRVFLLRVSYLIFYTLWLLHLKHLEKQV